MGENQRIIFVKNLVHYMKLRGVEQSDIVANLGYSASTVSDWVKGKKYPRVDAMQRLANYLGVVRSDLTSEKDTDDTPSDPTEAELLSIYRSLNTIGQAALMGAARGLMANPDMKKALESNTETA